MSAHHLCHMKNTYNVVNIRHLPYIYIEYSIKYVTCSKLKLCFYMNRLHLERGTIFYKSNYDAKYPLLIKADDTASYVMNVMACPGTIRNKRGVIPFHKAKTPSSL